MIWFGWVLRHINHRREFNAKSNFIHINSSISNYSVKQFNSIWPIDRTLSSAITPAQSVPGSDGNKGVLCIPKSSSFTGNSQSDCFASYQGHLFGGGLTPLLRCCQCILQPHPTKQYTELNVKTVQFRTIQFSISTQFKCQNCPISNNSV